MQHSDIFMCMLKSPLDDKWQASFPKLSRDTVPNKKLMKKKVSRRVPWNHTVLRFDWSEDTCERALSTTGSLSHSLTHTLSKVRQRAVAVMQRPISDEDSFAVRSWAKTGPVAECVRKGYEDSSACSSNGC